MRQTSLPSRLRGGEAVAVAAPRLTLKVIVSSHAMVAQVVGSV
jgi:hypothetical protein